MNRKLEFARVERYDRATGSGTARTESGEEITLPSHTCRMIVLRSYGPDFDTRHHDFRPAPNDEIVLIRQHIADGGAAAYCWCEKSRYDRVSQLVAARTPTHIPSFAAQLAVPA